MYRNLFRATGACLLFTFVAVSSGLAQSAAPAWVSLDGSKPGTSADVVFDKDKSNASTSMFSVVLHGFWTERKDGPGGPFTKITVPGIGVTQQRGAPSLPVVKLNLAVPTTATAIRLRSATASDTKTYSGVLIWPNPIPETDQEGSRPEQFVIDDRIYSQTTNYPGVSGAATEPVRAKLGSINGAAIESYPFQWNPSTKVLTVHRVTTFVYDHSGTTVSQREMTKDRGAFAAQKFANWASVSANFPLNLFVYEADFLFIYPDGYKNELQSLIDQKKTRGFSVTELTTTTTGHTCNSIRTAINNWYNSKPATRDKYALLVGDVNEIPLCSYAGTPTDDLYASTNGDDLDEEIYLGRLSVDSETDAANQVGKILAYEDNPSLFCCYNEALLVAHKEGAPGKYVGAHESVRTAAYAVPPTFSTLYGNAAGVTDGDVSAAINAGLGLVAYRGHGSSAAWTTWNLGGESYNSTDVTGLLNTMPRVPVLWSFACTNNDLNSADSIGEVWMESSSNRAVSFYGATIPSYTSQNHELDRRMFKAVYDLGLTTQSHAIEYAEEQMASIVGSDNAWMYLLLGDPDMQIRRRNPLSFTLKLPEYINICKGPGCYLTVSVLDQTGNPVSGARVSVWKEGKYADEVLTNHYTDRSGNAVLLVNAETPGTLFYSVKDEAGNTVNGKVAVK